MNHKIYQKKLYNGSNLYWLFIPPVKSILVIISNILIAIFSGTLINEITGINRKIAFEKMINTFSFKVLILIFIISIIYILYGSYLESRLPNNSIELFKIEHSEEYFAAKLQNALLSNGISYMNNTSNLDELISHYKKIKEV